MAYGIVAAETLQSGTAGAPPSFQDLNGVERGQLCRAWANFNGATGAIRASFNVSSVTRTAAGTYTVAFTNALADANYAVCPVWDGTRTTSSWPTLPRIGTLSAASFVLMHENAYSNTYTYGDNPIGSFAVFR